MNRNFLIAIVIAAAAVIAYFILSSPSEADKAAAGATGIPGANGLGTGAAPSGSSGNPLADLINGVMGGGSSANAGLLDGEASVVVVKANTPTYGLVTVYAPASNPFGHTKYILSSGEEVMANSQKGMAIKAEIVSGGKIRLS